jgi:hypothetical protein
MRLVLVPALLLLASLSGCVSLVEDGNDADLDAAADEASQAYSDYEARAGHISGTVLDGDGSPLAGALVDLVGIQEDLATDAKGRFAFLDLTPGVYTLSAQKDDFVSASTSVAVASGQFARPSLMLVSAAPAPYMTVFSFDGYQELSTLGFGVSCYNCDMSDTMDAEGLTQAVLEADLGGSPTPFVQADGFSWYLESMDEDGNTTYARDAYYEYTPAPMHEILDADEFTPGATRWVLHIEPTSSLQVSMQQQFHGFLSIFYNGPAPEGYSAYNATVPE